MKRYRVCAIDFDTRATILSQEIGESWEPSAKALWTQNKRRVESGLLLEFGEDHAEIKKQNFLDLGPKQISVLSFHNRFYHQIRIAFVMAAYYPALTGACALGERILNHLILKLRDHFRSTQEYKKVYRKNSFDDWNVPIDTLESWKVLQPSTATAFRALRDARNKALHFQPDVDKKDRELALEAIKLLGEVIKHQFTGWGGPPWTFFVPGEFYIKKQWESDPFVKLVFLPNCLQVSPYHQVTSVMPWEIQDHQEVEDREITDEEFVQLRHAFQRHAPDEPNSS